MSIIPAYTPYRITYGLETKIFMLIYLKIRFTFVVIRDVSYLLEQNMFKMARDPPRRQMDNYDGTVHNGLYQYPRLKVKEQQMDYVTDFTEILHTILARRTTTENRNKMHLSNLESEILQIDFFSYG